MFVSLALSSTPALPSRAAPLRSSDASRHLECSESHYCLPFSKPTLAGGLHASALAQCIALESLAVAVAGSWETFAGCMACWPYKECNPYPFFVRMACVRWPHLGLHFPSQLLFSGHAFLSITTSLGPIHCALPICPLSIPLSCTHLPASQGPDLDYNLSRAPDFNIRIRDGILWLSVLFIVCV